MTKKRLLITAIVIALLALLAYMQFRTWRSFNWQVFWEQTHEANKWKIAAGVALIYFTYLLRAVRWKLLLRPTKQVETGEMVAPVVIGFTALAILGRPGDLVRPYLISRRHGLGMSSQVAVLAVERIFDIGCFALLLLVDLLFAPSLRELPYYSRFRFAGLMLGVVVAVAIVVLFLIWRSTEAFASWVERSLGKAFPGASRTLCEKITTFGDGLHTIHDPASFFQIFGISLAIWSIIAYSYVQVTHAYGGKLEHMQFSHVLLLMSASIAGSLLQLPVVGGGSQLGTMGVLKAVFDVREELAASCGLMLWLVTFVAIVPVGLAWARLEHISLRESEVAAESQMHRAQP